MEFCVLFLFPSALYFLHLLWWSDESVTAIPLSLLFLIISWSEWLQVYHFYWSSQIISFRFYWCSPSFFCFLWLFYTYFVFPFFCFLFFPPSLLSFFLPPPLPFILGIEPMAKCVFYTWSTFPELVLIS
jgi:hypothetical protein